MNKETIIDRMQSYFSGENQNPEFDTSIEMDALQLFYVRTAKRLVIANELQHHFLLVMLLFLTIIRMQ